MTQFNPPQPGSFTEPASGGDSTQPLPNGLSGQSAPPAAAGALVTALRAIRAMLSNVWHGDNVAALRIASEYSARSVLLWWLVLLANAVLAGFLVASFVVKSAQGAASITNSVLDPFTGGYSSSYVDDAFSVPFSTVLGVVIAIAIVVVTVLVLRTVTVFWTFGVRGARGRFRDSAAIVATSYAATPLLLAVLWILSLIPGVGGVLLSAPVLAIGGLASVVISEGLLYIGLNRAVRFSKSPLIPHAALTVAHVAMCVVVFFLINVVVLASLIG